VTRKTVAGALSATAVCAAIYVTVVLEAHQHQPVYAMPITAVIVAGVCAGLTAIGGLLSIRSGQLAPWLAPVATAIMLYGFLVAGTLIVLPAIVLIVLVSRRTQSSCRREHAWLNAGPAVLLTVGLVPLGLLALWDQPIVQCFPGGVSVGQPIWTSFQSTSGPSGAWSSSSTPQQSSGAMNVGGVTYTYTCSGAQLVRFASG
jgi:hypothetical protein